MARAKALSAPPGRTSAKERRRQQLIESTIDSIAKRGFSETTVSHVAAGAKLSHGIVNFHFTSKDQLLVETLRYLAEEYRAVWKQAIAQVGPAPADRLAALLLAPFEPSVCTSKKVAVWHAFYGEVRSRPIYREICGARDQEYRVTAIELTGQTQAEGAYDGPSPETTAAGLEAITDGLWLDFLLADKPLDLAGARSTVLAQLSAVFPKHFPRNGVKGAVICQGEVG